MFKIVLTASFLLAVTVSSSQSLEQEPIERDLAVQRGSDTVGDYTWSNSGCKSVGVVFNGQSIFMAKANT